jgi:tetratricopeptide (TPR) repeat protein
MNKKFFLSTLSLLLTATSALALEKTALYTNGDNDQRGGSCIAKQSAHVNCYNGADVRAYDNTVIKAYDACTVASFDQSVVYADGNVKVTAHDNSRVIAGDDTQVDAAGSADVQASGNAVVIAHGNVAVYACDNTVVHAYDHVTVYGEGNAKVEAHDKCIVQSKQNCHVIAADDVAILAKVNSAYDLREAIFGTMSDPAKAIRDLSAKLNLNPTDEIALYNRAQADLRLGKVNNAFSDIQDALQLNPNNPNFYLVLAYVNHKQGNEALALENVKQAQFCDTSVPRDVNLSSLTISKIAKN